MEFSPQLIKTLIKNKDQVLQIDGINYLGQEFSTKGKLLSNAHIDSDAIGLYIGQYARNGKPNYITLFNTYQSDGRKCLYINSIKNAEGDLVYLNEDYDLIWNNCTLYGDSLTNSSILLPEEMKDIEQLIAKPVILTTDGYERTSVKSVQVLNNGVVKLESSNGTFESAHIIKDASSVKLDVGATIFVGNEIEM